MSLTRYSLSRRQLLKYGLLSATALAGTVVSKPVQSQETASSPRRIAIIGAGLAGLAAAYQLTQAGHQVTVLEARNRPGGRVYTVREPFSDHLYAEAGAFWIADNHDITLKYAALMNLSLIPNTTRTVFAHYYGRGQALDLSNLSTPEFPYQLTPEEIEAGFGSLFLKYFGAALAEVGATDLTLPPSSQLVAYDQLSVADFLRQQGASPDAIALLRMGYLDIWGDGVESYSVLQLLRDLALNTAPTYCQIEGGNDQLPQRLAEQLSPYISYQTPVTQIIQSADAVQVKVLANHSPQTIVADEVICTVPLTVLNQIELQPPLSAEKQRAIRELAYTSVSRVMVQTQTRYWQDQGKFGYTATDLPVGLVGDATFSQAGQRRGILESLTAGHNARQIAALSNADRLQTVLPHLDAVYPGIDQHIETSASISWDNDEWSKGGYIWFQPNQMSQLLPTIARSEGRIHFAGEHTSPWNGWMQGALESGERAAQEILRNG